MELIERVCFIEEKAVNLEKRVDILCATLSAASAANAELFGKLIDRMNILIMVTIVLSLISGMNVMEGVLRLIGVMK